MKEDKPSQMHFHGYAEKIFCPINKCDTVIYLSRMKNEMEGDYKFYYNCFRLDCSNNSCMFRRPSHFKAPEKEESEFLVGDNRIPAR